MKIMNTKAIWTNRRIELIFLVRLFLPRATAATAMLTPIEATVIT